MKLTVKLKNRRKYIFEGITTPIYNNFLKDLNNIQVKYITIGPITFEKSIFNYCITGEENETIA